MTALGKALNHLTDCIKKYRTANLMDGECLNTCLQQITATLFYLETERAKVHEKFQQHLNLCVLEGMAVSRAENEANVKYPEMYKLRRIMEAGYECVGAIRSNLSWLKAEKSNFV